MVSTGFAIFLGLMFLLAKLPRRWTLRLLHYDLALDLSVTLLVLALHFGTFSGLMAATVAGVLTSVGTSVAKHLVGHVHRDQYHPGVIRLEL
jgi:NhaP-type Na+/H+ or K+/H+ antiporter